MVLSNKGIHSCTMLILFLKNDLNNNLNKKRFGLYKIYVLYITCLIFVRKISLKILIGYIKSWYTKISMETKGRVQV